MSDENIFPLKVYLLRHAHAAWARPGQRDFDRPLDEKGRQDAALMANVMRKRGYSPNLVLCSTAERCAETLRLVADVLPAGTEIRLLESMYGNDYRHYLQLIRETMSSSVMLVGHNPMIEDTANALAASAEDKAAIRLQKGFPTAGLAIIELDHRLQTPPDGGHLRELLTPKKAHKLLG